MDFIDAYEVDRLFCWPAGRALRLARKGKLPHHIAPDGKTFLFRRDELTSLVDRGASLPNEIGGAA
ncbi:MAG TPA: hypothetical protein VGP72_02505 [Planctomycetota bacterium]|jgi:hypothetical protein